MGENDSKNISLIVAFILVFIFSIHLINVHFNYGKNLKPLNDTICSCDYFNNQSNYNLKPKVINGEPVHKNDLKWTAIIFLKGNFGTINNEKIDSLLLCSGAVISPFFILTASHCLKDAKAFEDNFKKKLTDVLYVGAGLDHNFIKIINSKNNHRKVLETYQHPDYDPSLQINAKTLESDVSLYRLEDKFEFNEITNIKPGCLLSMVDLMDLDDKKLYFAGYGRTDYLNDIDMTKTDYSLLILNLKIDTIFNKFRMGDRIFTLNENGSVCSGDSGGPLLMEKIGKDNVSNKLFIIGVSCATILNTKKGILCEPGSSSIFTSIEPHLSFLLSIVENEEICLEGLKPRIEFNRRLYLVLGLLSSLIATLILLCIYKVNKKL